MILTWGELTVCKRTETNNHPKMKSCLIGAMVDAGTNCLGAQRAGPKGRSGSLHGDIKNEIRLQTAGDVKITLER